jgi:ABC transport system ATP-binding/permease protein
VVTSTLVAEGEGFWREYEGGVQDWLVQSARAKEIASKSAPAASSVRSDKGNATPVAVATADAAPKKKLSFKEQRELDGLPALMAQMEAEQAKTRQLLQDGKLYTRDPAAASQLHARDVAIDEELLAALERQEALLARS